VRSSPSAALEERIPPRLDRRLGTPDRYAFYSPDNPAPLTVLVSFEMSAPVRVERLLMLGLGLSRAEVRRMVADQRIRLPMALDAKAHQDFELTVDGGRSARPPPGARSPHPRQLTCALISAESGFIHALTVETRASAAWRARLAARPGLLPDAS
jgi:hypothetical protein